MGVLCSVFFLFKRREKRFWIKTSLVEYRIRQVADNLSHTTFANLLKNLVMANGLAEHTTPPHRNAVGVNVTRGGGLKAMEKASGAIG